MKRCRMLPWLVMALGWCVVQAAGVTPDLQRRIRGATFEVVQKKPEKDPLSYEKPLPLELLPYIERTDAYRSIGTAFALGHNTYVTAAHVLVIGVGSQYGAPALRSADGRVHTIDHILKFSLHEDFAVFSLVADPGPQSFGISTNPSIDDPVLAVGNALGEGIVIRDGLYTSETPEQQDGRWKWMRFSAAASPGNSGGPLLDARGRVIGIVIGKSQNENLNYSLPIARVLDGPADNALFDRRVLEAMAPMQTTRIYELVDRFALPKSWGDFSRAYLELMDRHGAKSRSGLLEASAAARFPRGKGVEALLYDVDYANFPRLIAQGSDDSWAADKPSSSRIDLGGDGSVDVANQAGVVLVRVRRPDNASDSGFYADSKGSMDLALAGLDLRRPVGTDAVRVTSLGPATTDTRYMDHYGRRWQERTWAIPFLDFHVVALQLPTPDGYMALVQYTPSILASEALRRLEFIADFVCVSYWGSMPQWQAFLARGEMLPDALTEVSLQKRSDQQGWRLATPRFSLDLQPGIMPADSGNMLGLAMTYLPEGQEATWAIGAAAWFQDATEKSSVSVTRQLRPPASASRKLRDRWDDLVGQRSPFDGQPVRTGSSAWEVKTLIDVPGSHPGTVADDLGYLLELHMENAAPVEDARAILTRARTALQMHERGSDGRVAGEPGRTSTGSVTGEIDRAIADLTRYAESAREYVSTSWPGADKDMRGRKFADDAQEYVLRAKQDRLRQWRAIAEVAEQSGRHEEVARYREMLEELRKETGDAISELRDYWGGSNQLTSASNLWREFLARNNLPADTPRSAQVVALEKQLREQFVQTLSNGTLGELAYQLNEAYQQERRALQARIADAVPSGGAHLRKRSTACPPPKKDVEEGTHPAQLRSVIDIGAYYPTESRRLGVTGTVRYALHVDANGCLGAIGLIVSSGSRELDDAAALWLEEGAEFLPATENGNPVSSVKELNVTFRLKD